jgi:hypothetical protein
MVAKDAQNICIRCHDKEYGGGKKHVDKELPFGTNKVCEFKEACNGGDADYKLEKPAAEL